MNSMQLTWLLNSVRMLLICSGNGVLFFPGVLVTVTGYITCICLAMHKNFSIENESLNTGRPDLADT